MNPNMKTSIGSPMIKISAITTPPVPTAEPVGRVAGGHVCCICCYVGY